MCETTALYIEFCEFVNFDSTFNIIRISCSKTRHLQKRSGWKTALLYRTPTSRIWHPRIGWWRPNVQGQCNHPTL